jgi:hypothetical protein
MSSLLSLCFLGGCYFCYITKKISAMEGYSQDEEGFKSQQ